MKILIFVICILSCLSLMELKSNGTHKSKIKLHHKKYENSTPQSVEHPKINEDALKEYISMIEKKMKSLKIKAKIVNSNSKSLKRDKTNGSEDNLNFMETSSRTCSRLEELETKIDENQKTASNQENTVNNLSKKLEELDKVFNELKNQRVREKKLMVNVDVENASAGNLTVKRAEFNNLHVKSLSVGGLNLGSSSSVIKLNLTDKIEIGKESITAQNILEIIEFVRQVKSFCGDYFRDCRIILESQYNEEQKNMTEIKDRMENLKQHFK